MEWERLTGVPLDADESVGYVLLAAPTFAKIDDLLQGKSAAPTSLHHASCSRSCCAGLDHCTLLPTWTETCCLFCNSACMPAGLDFAYPDAAKIGGMVSGPPQQGAGTSDSPSGWLIAVERWVPPPAPLPAGTSTNAQQEEAQASAPVAAGERTMEASTSGGGSEAGAGSGQAGSGQAGSDGQVVRQLVWGGCAAVVLRGAVSIEPLIAQVARMLPDLAPHHGPALQQLHETRRRMQMRTGPS